MSTITKAILCLLLALLTSCSDEDVSREKADVKRQQLIYVTNQPPPTFDWSLERHLMTQLYRARNSAVATYSYIRNQYTGKVTSWCPSMGYPIPADTQLTNPLQIVYHSQHGSGVIEQAEPNGMYTSKNTRGTFVMCVDKEGMVVPRYHEQDAEAYLTPMREVNGMLVEVEGFKPAFRIDPHPPQTPQATE